MHLFGLSLYLIQSCSGCSDVQDCESRATITATDHVCCGKAGSETEISVICCKVRLNTRQVQNITSKQAAIGGLPASKVRQTHTPHPVPVKCFCVCCTSQIGAKTDFFGVGLEGQSQAAGVTVIPSTSEGIKCLPALLLWEHCS